MRSPQALWTRSALAAALAATSLLLVPPAQAAADGCASGVPMDFNGDGYSDAAVANSTASEGGQAAAGRVTIRYGDSDGLVGQGTPRNIRADTGTSSSGIVQPGARFGFSTATADLDCDGYTDLVVSAPFFDAPGAADSGNVTLLYGGPGGFNGASRQEVWSSETFGQTRAAGDRFGYSLDAVEDLGQGGTPAPDAYGIIIGVPYRDTEGRVDCGAVAVATAVDGSNDRQWIDQQDPLLEGAAEDGNLFGFSVAFGHTDADTATIDALVGVPYEDIDSADDAGAVYYLKDLYGSEFTEGISIHQNSPGVPGAAETGDQFGRVVDASTNGQATRAVVGAPYEDIGKLTNAGTVQLFAKLPGQSMKPGIALTQDTTGVEGAVEKFDYFGSDLAIGPNYYTAIGVPGEDTTVVDAGSVQVVPLTNVANDKAYTQASAGVPGTVRAGEKLGSSVGVVDGASENVVLAGVPADVEYADGVVNVFPFTAGSPRAWVPTGVGGGFGDGFASQGR